METKYAILIGMAVFFLVAAYFLIGSDSDVSGGGGGGGGGATKQNDPTVVEEASQKIPQVVEETAVVLTETQKDNDYAEVLVQMYLAEMYETAWSWMLTHEHGYTFLEQIRANTNPLNKYQDYSDLSLGDAAAAWSDRKVIGGVWARHIKRYKLADALRDTREARALHKTDENDYSPNTVTMTYGQTKTPAWPSQIYYYHAERLVYSLDYWMGGTNGREGAEYMTKGDGQGHDASWASLHHMYEGNVNVARAVMLQKMVAQAEDRMGKATAAKEKYKAMLAGYNYDQDNTNIAESGRWGRLGAFTEAYRRFLADAKPNPDAEYLRFHNGDQENDLQSTYDRDGQEWLIRWSPWL
jgi:hypothetical protein